MVFGHNLHLMAPFEILEAGFCTELRRASFWVLCPRVDFWTTDPFLGPPGHHFGPGTFLGQFWGPEKDSFVMKSFCGGSAGESLLPK